MKIFVFFTIIILSAPGLQAQKGNAEISRGNKAYQEKNYSKAISEYEEALKQAPGNPAAIFNQANALFRENKTEEAEKKFEEAIDLNASKQLNADSWYNKGVSLTSQKKLEESIDAYKHALRINPSDTLARENLLRALRELKKKQDQEDDQKKKEQEKKQEQKKPQPKMEDQRVQQLLQRLEEKEKQLQQKLNQQKVPAPGQPAKDW